LELRLTSADVEGPYCVESFNSRVRDECLNINMFWSLAQARVVISDWKEDYNNRRPHSALGYQTAAV
jgi:putative transposase